MSRFAYAPGIALLLLLTAHADEAKIPGLSPDAEAAARLQIFLDRAEFSPGEVDGRWGALTTHVLALYRQAKGEPLKPEPKDKDGPPDMSGLDLSSIHPVFITYKVTATDLEDVGKLAHSPAAEAKEKSLPYPNGMEAVAEKFHCSNAFLRELNKGHSSELHEGDILNVPNVTPFELSAVKELTPGSNAASESTKEPAPEPKEKEKAKAGDKSPHHSPLPEPEPPLSIQVDTHANILTLLQKDKIIAVYPVTIGSHQTQSPIGEWKIESITKFPNFRYDREMLQHGERSGNYHVLPPGPRNPVGIIWVQLNKKGIGLHGTDDPDSIGRSASHGCVRLANWDIYRLASRVREGVPVTIK